MAEMPKELVVRVPRTRVKVNGAQTHYEGIFHGFTNDGHAIVEGIRGTVRLVDLRTHDVTLIHEEESDE